MKLLQYIVLTLFLFMSHLSFSQYYTTGADPAYIRWRQINSPYFRVVYPGSYESEAKRLTSILDSLYRYGGYSMNHYAKRIPVLIHSETAYSNGLVTWAPKRMELYPTPNQNIFAQDYLEQLALHEFRHVIQIDKLNTGFTRFLSYPFGEQAIGGVLGLYVPLWFLEGDAVLSETTLSQSGRGRLPAFEQEIRAQVLEKESYSYEKAYFGSYRDYVPNHYRMGYLLVAGARHKYGAALWEKALLETGRNSWSITPFNKGIKAVSGLNKVPLYHETFEDWKTRWLAVDDSISPSPHHYITERDPGYLNYLYPVAIDDSHVVAEAGGPGEVRHFVLINTQSGRKEKLLTLGYKNQEPFCYARQTLYWTELEQHPRWENQYFSVIRSYNLKSGEQKKLTRQSRYYAPAMAQDGHALAAVYISPSNKREIHLLDPHSGDLLKSIPIPANHLPLTPRWNRNNRDLVMVLLTSQGKKITVLNTTNQSWNDVTRPDFTELTNPVFFQDRILFSAAWSGIDNIYSIKTDGSQLLKLTESRFGAQQPSPGYDGLSLLYQDYTSDGYQIATVPFARLRPEPFAPRTLPGEAFIQKLVKDEKGIPRLKDLPDSSYQSQAYSKWNIFNFHSWAPLNINMDEEIVTPGLSLMSQNLLGTAITTMGYNADSQYSREKYYFSMAYRAWWPVIELEVKAGDQRYYDQNYYVSSTDTFKLNLDDREQNLYASLELNMPINLTRGRWLRRLFPSVSLGYQYNSGLSYSKTTVSREGNQIIEKETETITRPELHARLLNYGLQFYNLSNRSERDITSRWGQLLELNYRHTPVGGIDLGNILAVHSRLYLPGLGKHHSIRIDNDWQNKKHGEAYYNDGSRHYYRYFGDLVQFPRGIRNTENDELYSFKGDYIFPLINPDLNLPGVMYLKRITSQLFYDYTRAGMQVLMNDTDKWDTHTHHYESLGFELRAELHPLRFVYPMTVGYRYAYLPGTRQNYNEFLIGLGFSSFTLGH